MLQGQILSQSRDDGALRPPRDLSQMIRHELLARDEFGDFVRCVHYHTAINPTTGMKEGLLYLMNPYHPNPHPIPLRTRASAEEVEEILRKVSPTREFCEMLVHMAVWYQLGNPVFIQGGTAVGKTFMVNTFTELVYGLGVRPIDFYCSGQTDVGELVGRWAPDDGRSAETTRRWKGLIESQAGSEKLKEISDRVDGVAAVLGVDGQASMYQASLRQLATEVGLGDASSFTFRHGAIPKAFGGEFVDGEFRMRPGAEGFILHVQEPGLAKPDVLNALLRVRGEQGEIAPSFQLWEKDGSIIHRGPKTFIVFTNNPADGYIGRKEIDKAFKRHPTWLEVGEGLSEESLRMTARKIFTYRLGNDRPPLFEADSIDLRGAPEIGQVITEAVVPIHITLARRFSESDAMQECPVVMDDMFKVARLMQTFQRRNQFGCIDLATTLENAIDMTYLGRASWEERQELQRLVHERIFGKTSVSETDPLHLPLGVRLNALVEGALGNPPQCTIEDVVQEDADQSFLDSVGSLRAQLANKTGERSS